VVLFFEQGCIELLSRITMKGKKAVVVGRSNIVGLPVSLLLLKADATVTVVHSHSHDPESIIREADIIIAAAGQAMMVTKDSSWIVFLVLHVTSSYLCCFMYKPFLALLGISSTSGWFLVKYAIKQVVALNTSS
jgi:NAD(P)-dependent dehydrogenase (short-subunit alcohol dehydrogenase family)